MARVPSVTMRSSSERAATTADDMKDGRPSARSGRATSSTSCTTAALNGCHHRSAGTRLRIALQECAGTPGATTKPQYSDRVSVTAKAGIAQKRSRVGMHERCIVLAPCQTYAGKTVCATNWATVAQAVKSPSKSSAQRTSATKPVSPKPQNVLQPRFRPYRRRQGPTRCAAWRRRGPTVTRRCRRRR